MGNLLTDYFLSFMIFIVGGRKRRGFDKKTEWKDTLRFLVLTHLRGSNISVTGTFIAYTETRFKIFV